MSDQSSTHATKREATPIGAAWNRLAESFQPRHWAASALLLVLAVAALDAMGRPWLCEAGDLPIWSGEVFSRHNSQHFLDPYTLTHVLHGIGFYALLWLCLGRWTGTGVRGVLTIGLESLWEVVENTAVVIDRYRESTIALGYYGDSVFNSLGDILACGAGFLIALVFPAWASTVLFLGLELVLLLWIRDSLILNIVMLIYPMDWIRNWQTPE